MDDWWLLWLNIPSLPSLDAVQRQRVSRLHVNLNPLFSAVQDDLTAFFEPLSVLSYVMDWMRHEIRGLSD